jgi:hypothetical protein
MGWRLPWSCPEGLRIHGGEVELIVPTIAAQGAVDCGGGYNADGEKVFIQGRLHFGGVGAEYEV